MDSESRYREGGWGILCVISDLFISVMCEHQKHLLGLQLSNCKPASENSCLSSASTNRNRSLIIITAQSWTVFKYQQQSVLRAMSNKPDSTGLETIFSREHNDSLCLLWRVEKLSVWGSLLSLMLDISWLAKRNCSRNQKVIYTFNKIIMPFVYVHII